MKNAQNIGIKAILPLLCISIVSVLCACGNQAASNAVPSEAASSGGEMVSIAAEQNDLTLSIPKGWDAIAVVLTNSDAAWSSEESKDTLLFELREKLAYTSDQSIGRVWGLYTFTKDAFAKRFGDADPAEIVGANSYIIGTDDDHVYLLTEPTDVQFLEDDEESKSRYERLQKESQSVLEDFLKNNRIAVNAECPDSACYSVNP